MGAVTGVPSGCEPRCQGCVHRGWDAKQSESQKYRWLHTRLEPWNDSLEPVRGVDPDRRWHYRRKTCLHAAWKDGSWVFGLLAPVPGQWREYEIIDIPRCPIHDPLILRLIDLLKRVIPGNIPLVFLSVSGTLATLVYKSDRLPSLPDITWEGLGLTGVYANLNPSAGNRVFSSRGWKHIWGQRFGVEGGFQYGPDSFQQLIPLLHEGALEEAEKFFGLQPNDAVVDLCSGIGRSLSRWKESGASCIGVELSGDAVEWCNENVGTGFCLRGRASERLPQVEAWLREKEPSRLFLYANPPRLGLEPEVLQWIHEKSRPEKVAYLSCSAGTLARDLQVLTQNGYSLKRIIPYDFFPQTQHIETLALLVR